MKTFQLKEGQARVQQWNDDYSMVGGETYFDQLGPVQYVVTPMGPAYQIQLMFMVDHILMDDAGGVVRGSFNQVKASEERLAKDADLVLKQPGIKGKIMTELAEDKVKALMQHVIDSEKKQHMDITPNTDGPPVHIGPDGLCKCGEHSEHSEHSDPCPLGKIKGVEKCTSRELMAAGVSCIIESDPDDVASPAAYGAIDPLGDDVTPEGKTFNGVPVPVKIGLDGMCKCGDSDPCPLAIDPTKGRKPYHQKCSVLHLINEGVPYVVEADDVAHQPGPETFPLNDDVVEHEIHSHPGDEELAAESFTDAGPYLTGTVGPIPIVKVGPDHLCNCGESSKCPLGKTGNAIRCSTSELKAAGVPHIYYDSYQKMAFDEKNHCGLLWWPPPHGPVPNDPEDVKRLQDFLKP